MSRPTSSIPPHKQDNGQDHNHKAMAARMHRDNDHEHGSALADRQPDHQRDDRSHADRNDRGGFRSDDNSGHHRGYDAGNDGRDYRMSNRREDRDDNHRYVGDDDSDYRNRPGYGGPRDNDDGLRNFGVSDRQSDQRPPRPDASREPPANHQPAQGVDLNDRQNGWQNGPRVDAPNNDRERDSWRSDDRGYGDHYNSRQTTHNDKS